MTVLEHEQDGDDLIVLCPPREVPTGYRTVLRAQDWSGESVVLAHADDDRLRRMAVLDVVLNNADRKGGHVLAGLDGAVHGVDHGICLHAQHKLRTVLWGWAGEPLHPEDAAVVTGLAEQVADPVSDLSGRLAGLLDEVEVRALLHRMERLLGRGRMPVPSGQWPAIPWPAF